MKTIIEMAREADPKANLNEPYRLDHEKMAWLERFAELVRADEREACAKVCESNQMNSWSCAQIIRARGNTCTPPIAADPEAFYGLPQGSVSTPNAGGKCVTAGETAPVRQIDPNAWAFDRGLEST